MQREAAVWQRPCENGVFVMMEVGCLGKEDGVVERSRRRLSMIRYFTSGNVQAEMSIIMEALEFSSVADLGWLRAHRECPRSSMLRMSIATKG